MLLQTTNIQFSCDKDKLSVKLLGDIDHHNAVSIRERIDSEVFRARPKVLVLDLSNVEFMDSSGLGLVLGRAAKCATVSARVEVVGAGERIRKIFTLAGAERMITISEEKQI